MTSGKSYQSELYVQELRLATALATINKKFTQAVVLEFRVFKTGSATWKKDLAPSVVPLLLIKWSRKTAKAFHR